MVMLCFSLMVVKVIRSQYWYKEGYEKKYVQNMYFCVCVYCFQTQCIFSYMAYSAM